MPRTKGAKDKSLRKPKGSLRNNGVDLGEERNLSRQDDMGANEGVQQDFSNEANQDITTPMSTTENTNKSGAAAEGQGDNQPNPATASGGGNFGGGGIKPPTIEDVKFEMVPGDEDLPDNNPRTDFSPITEAQVIERDYAVNKTIENAPPIEEPVIIAPKFDDAKPPDIPGSISQPATQPITNPEMAEKSLEEKKRGAEMMVDGLLDVYSGIGEIAARWVEVSPMQIAKLAEEGKLDPDYLLHLETGQVTVSAFVDSYNRQTKDIMLVSQQFRDDVRPPLIRIFTNRGWGASDEQYVLFKFGKDIMMKAGAVYSLKSTMNGVLTALQKNYKELKENTLQLDEYGNRINQQETALNEQATTIAQLSAQLKAERAAAKKKEEELEKIKQDSAKSGKSIAPEAVAAAPKKAAGKGGKASVKVERKQDAKHSMREPEEQ